MEFESTVKELTHLGIRLDAQYISQCRQSLHGQREHRRNLREAQFNEDKARNAEWSWFLQSLGMDSIVYDDLEVFADTHPCIIAEFDHDEDLQQIRPGTSSMVIPPTPKG